MMLRGHTAVQKTAILGSFVACNGGAIFVSIFYTHILELYAPSQLCRSYVPAATHPTSIIVLSNTHPINIYLSCNAHCIIYTDRVNPHVGEGLSIHSG